MRRPMLQRNLKKEAEAQDSSPTWPWLRIGEETLTEAHVLTGGHYEEAPREDSLSDFFLEHEIGSAAGWSRQNPESIAGALCRARTGVAVPDEMREAGLQFLRGNLAMHAGKSGE